MEMIKCCNGCTEETGRTVDCHSFCQKYLEEKRIHEEQLEEKRHQMNNDRIHKDFVQSGVMKSAKRRRRKYL